MNRFTSNISVLKRDKNKSSLEVFELKTLLEIVKEEIDSMKNLVSVLKNATPSSHNIEQIWAEVPNRSNMKLEI